MRSLDAWWDECKQEWMIIHANNKCKIQKTGKHACVWSESPQRQPSVKNSVIHATTVRWEQKVKWCFYKLTYIKTTTSAHWNQVDITHTKQNTKSERNATQDMKSRLTTRQLSWMCQRLLDGMWDVKATRSMWGKSFVVSGWRVFDKIMVMLRMPQI